MTRSSDIVVAEQLWKSFGAADGSEVTAIKGISMSVGAGQLTGLVGADAAGKTTLLRMMAGLLKPDGGTLHVLGLDVAKDWQKVQDQISYMPQRFGLYDDLTVFENLGLYADLHGVPETDRQNRFDRLLQMTGLAPFTERLAGKLSGGMKQKLGLACTLVRSPSLLLLDEPSVGVDPLSRRDLWHIIMQLVVDERLTVVVSTAYMDEADRCDRVIVMDRGTLLAEGSPSALRAGASGRTFIATPPPGLPAREMQVRLIECRDLVVDAVPRGGSVSFITRSGTLLAELANRLPDICFDTREEVLEDAFMILLRESDGAADPAPEPLVEHVPHHPRQGPIVQVRDLVRRFGNFTAVANTSFDVAQGEIFGLLGPNGAGKTTTFRMLCGLLPASSGRIEVAGRNLRTARAQGRARIGYVAQKFSLYGNLTVRENLAFFGGAYGLRGAALRDRIQVSLSQFDLDPEAKSGNLPAGYRQRLAMATGLLHGPDILFLDEPTSGIDPLARRSFWRSITSLAKAGVTIIVTTHFMEEAEYCDRIAIQDAGRMLVIGTPDEVRREAGTQGGADMNSVFISIVEQARARSSGLQPR
ncbi:ATP-binding cassette domain-containing protein [Paracoccus sp. MBLB3053]|uniref:ATP-binding cassette domain-containing protein n=1 Tax=Paracoccus aurantius TaxID=3073814 RepID=A0ABU2HWQ7_9RHOB|nr:ATP-binding cassette domain-containing protein [Paracoccus sp. MBLB3053]MDS9469446.1 ATP-binding cassette domain-containing protein [Paracoccus sp. MBLB3053]